MHNGSEYEIGDPNSILDRYLQLRANTLGKGMNPHPSQLWVKLQDLYQKKIFVILKKMSMQYSLA